MDVKHRVFDRETGLPTAETPVVGTPGRRKALSLRARLMFVMLTAAITLGVQYWIHEPQAENRRSSASASGPEFDWYAVSTYRLHSVGFFPLTNLSAQLEPSTDINWTPCFDGHQCARLLLPLDYLEPEGPTTAIALRMIPATSRGTSSYRGTVLINPGGPGGSGTGLVGRAGANISRIVGDSFDVLGFDPRGTGASTPNADCFGSASQKAIWKTQMGHQFLNASDETLGLYRARQQVVAARCEQRIGGEQGIARFMSTASVARDMLEITQKMGQEKLHYWGFVSASPPPCSEPSRN